MADVVLIHGFPFDATMWAHQVTVLREAGHRVLAMDVGGLGESAIPTATPDVNVMAEQVTIAMDAAGVERAIIGGLSMGGYVAMAMLRFAPERVAGLMLIDTKASADDPERRAMRKSMAETMRQAQSTEVLARSMPQTLVSATTAKTQPSVVIDLADRIRRANQQAVAWCQVAMASRPDSLSTLRSAGALPALVLCGADDMVTPVSDHEQLVAALRDAGGQPQFVVIPEAGHMSALESPDAVSSAIVEFLSTLVAR